MNGTSATSAREIQVAVSSSLIALVYSMGVQTLSSSIESQ